MPFGPSAECASLQRLIAVGHSLWGFKNWNWTLTKQELDYADATDNGFEAGVASFVSVVVDSLGLHRENVGYAIATGTGKGIAIGDARKASVTNALYETLVSFGGSVAARLTEPKRSESERADLDGAEEPRAPSELKNSSPAPSHRKDSSDSSGSAENNRAKNVRSPRRRADGRRSEDSTTDGRPSGYPANHTLNPPSLPPPPSDVRPPTVGAPPRPPYVRHAGPPPPFAVRVPYARSPPNYRNAFFAEIPPWPTYDGRGAVVNFEPPPPKNFESDQSGNRTSFDVNGSWIKPTVFYGDGFWTEQKVQKWVAEQTEKSTAIEEAQKQMCHSKV